MTKTIEGDLILEEDKTFKESIKVKGDIKRKDGECPDLTVKGNIDAWNIDAWNIDAGNIYAWDIDADDISFYAYCIARKNISCTSIEGGRNNSIYKALDGEVEIRDKTEKCEECGQVIEE